MKKIFFFLLILTCTIATESLGQEEKLNPELLTWYKQTLPFFQDIINGGQYGDAPASYLGSPFYGSGKTENGQIWINGLGYDKIPLLYDAWLDEVVTVHPRYNQKTLIKAEKIDKFVLANGALFLRFSFNPGYAKHHHGFYQVLADGELKLLKKDYRTVDSVNETGLITRKFTEGRDYFYWYQGKFWKVGSKTEGTLALGLFAKEVNRHLKGRGMVFKKNPEGYLLELLKLKERTGDDFKGFPER